MKHLLLAVLLASLFISIYSQQIFFTYIVQAKNDGDDNDWGNITTTSMEMWYATHRSHLFE
jgi:hypothetical protein